MMRQSWPDKNRITLFKRSRERLKRVIRGKPEAETLFTLPCTFFEYSFPLIRPETMYNPACSGVFSQRQEIAS